MPIIEPTIFHHNRYSAQTTYEHCVGVRHEPGCLTSNSLVYYACESGIDASRLSLLDRLSLHSPGVALERAGLRWRVSVQAVPGVASRLPLASPSA